MGVSCFFLCSAKALQLEMSSQCLTEGIARGSNQARDVVILTIQRFFSSSFIGLKIRTIEITKFITYKLIRYQEAVGNAYLHFWSHYLTVQGAFDIVSIQLSFYESSK